MWVGIGHASDGFVDITHVLECCALCYGRGVSCDGFDYADTGLEDEEEGGAGGKYVWSWWTPGGVQWVYFIIEEDVDNVMPWDCGVQRFVYFEICMKESQQI